MPLEKVLCVRTDLPARDRSLLPKGREHSISSLECFATGGILLVGKAS